MEKKLKTDEDEKDDKEAEKIELQQFMCIVTPVLDKDKDCRHVYGYSQPCNGDPNLNVNEHLQDQPLCFKSSTLSCVQTKNTNSKDILKHLEMEENIVPEETKCNCQIQKIPALDKKSANAIKDNLLHISYSDSSDSDG